MMDKAFQAEYNKGAQTLEGRLRARIPLFEWRVDRSYDIASGQLYDLYHVWFKSRSSPDRWGWLYLHASLIIDPDCSIKLDWLAQHIEYEIGYAVA